MDEEEALNITRVNSTFDEDEIAYRRDTDFRIRLFLELFTTIGLLSMLASILIAFVIIKFKKLQRDITNVIILNFTIVQAVYLVSSPLTMRFIIDIGLISPITSTMFCILNEIEGVLLIALLLFIILLVVDWFLKIYYIDRYVKFRNVCKFLIGAIYIIMIFLSSLTTQNCIRYYYMTIVILFVMLLYLIVLVFMVIVNVVHQFKARKLPNNKFSKNIGLALANIFIASWLPALFMLLLAIYCMGCIMPTIHLVTVILGFTYPITMCLFLFFVDDNFNIFIKRVLKCQCNEYENDQLEDHSVIFNDNRVEICENP